MEKKAGESLYKSTCFLSVAYWLSATVIRGRRKLEGSFPSNRFYCYLREGWVVETHSAAKFSSGEDSSEAFKTKPLSKGARFTRQKLRAGSLSFFKITICASA